MVNCISENSNSYPAAGTILQIIYRRYSVGEQALMNVVPNNSG